MSIWVLLREVRRAHLVPMLALFVRTYFQTGIFIRFESFLYHLLSHFTYVDLPLRHLS